MQCRQNESKNNLGGKKGGVAAERATEERLDPLPCLNVQAFNPGTKSLRFAATEEAN